LRLNINVGLQYPGSLAAWEWLRADHNDGDAATAKISGRRSGSGFGTRPSSATAARHQRAGGADDEEKLKAQKDAGRGSFSEQPVQIGRSTPSR
jgi:hypothetical protein